MRGSTERRRLLVRVEGLVKTYAGGVRAVDGLSFSVAAGQAYALLGRNGAGKTTTVRALVGLVGVDAGTARIGGVDVVRSPEAVRRLVGYAAQGSGVDIDLTVRENLVLRGRLHGSSADRAVERTNELCRTFGLEDLARRRAGMLSGGQRRRLDLASALVHNPQVLLLDEPTTGLDPQSRRLLWGQIEQLIGQGRAVVLTTQYLEEADRLCHRIGILDAGRLVAEGTPASLKSRVGGHVLTIELASDRQREQRRAITALDRIRGLGPLARNGAALTAPIDDPVGPVSRGLQALARARIRVVGVRVSPPSLEDVYLHYTGDDADDDETPKHHSTSVSAALTGGAARR